MVIVVRLDLDSFCEQRLTTMILEGIISISEASESKWFKSQTPYAQLIQVRHWQKMKKLGELKYDNVG